MRRNLFLFTLIGLLFFLGNGMSLAETTAFNSGLAIVEDITQDENGLIILDGLFSITDLEKFPGVDNFKVYSRWTGIGTHTIKIQIADSDDNIIADSDEVNLEFKKDYETYYQVFDFNNTVFPKPGIYWVDALLDDKRDFSMPLFIQSNDKDITFRNPPESPVLAFSLPALDVKENDNKLQVVSGVFEYFIFDRFPAAYDFIIANAWYSGDGKYTQYIELLDPEGNIIYKSNPQQFENRIKAINVVYDKLEDIIFPNAGRYILKVYLDGKLVFGYPILVTEQQ
ncbi:MAG: DUF6941 family protein [bacterium]